MADTNIVTGPDTPVDKFIVSPSVKMTAAQVAHMLGIDPSQVQPAPEKDGDRVSEAADTNRRALEANDIGRREIARKEKAGVDPVAVPLSAAPVPHDNYTTDEAAKEKAAEAEVEQPGASEAVAQAAERREDAQDAQASANRQEAESQRQEDERAEQADAAEQRGKATEAELRRHHHKGKR